MMKRNPFSAMMQSIDQKVKVKLGKPVMAQFIPENAGGNDTVPVSVRRVGCMHSVKCCCCSWLFVELFALEWSVRPRVSVF